MDTGRQALLDWPSWTRFHVLTYARALISGFCRAMRIMLYAAVFMDAGAPGSWTAAQAGQVISGRTSVLSDLHCSVPRLLSRCRPGLIARRKRSLLRQSDGPSETPNPTGCYARRPTLASAHGLVKIK
jgi:hypothetical protein